MSVLDDLHEFRAWKLKKSAFDQPSLVLLIAVKIEGAKLWSLDVKFRISSEGNNPVKNSSEQQMHPLTQKGFRRNSLAAESPPEHL